MKKVKEHEDYHVQWNKSLGAGANGIVYPAYWYLQSGTREELAIKKVNFCYICNGHGHKEPCDLTMFLQNGLLFLNFYFEQKKLSFLSLYLYQLHILTFLISTLLLSLFLL